VPTPAIPKAYHDTDDVGAAPEISKLRKLGDLLALGQAHYRVDNLFDIGNHPATPECAL
jgi:hypothetical protein